MTDKFRDDVKQGFDGIGDDFGKQFSRDASARLRAERPVFEDEGERIGEAAGDAAGREFADGMKDNGVRFGDDASPFVAVGKRLGEQVGDAAGKAFAKAMGKEASAGFSQALDPIKRFELQLAQAELAARRAGLAAAEAGERAKAASDRAAEAAEKVKRGEGDKEEAIRLAAAAAREQEKAEIAATTAQLAKVKVSERAAQVSQAYAKAQADSSRDTDRLSDSIRSRLTPDLDRSSGVMSGLAGVAKGLGGAFTSVASSMTLLGAGAAGVATLGAAAASSAGYVAELAAAIAPLSGLLAGLPGVALTGAAAFTTWKLATGGLGEAMGAALSGNGEALSEILLKLSDGGKAFVREFGEVIPQLKAFKGAAQDAFTDQLAGALQPFVAGIAGLKPSLAELAAAFGGITRSVLEFVSAGDTVKKLDQVLVNTRTLLGGIWSALDPLLRGFTDLGVVGSNWLASFAPGLQGVLTTFGQWMSQVSSSGQAWQWLNDATDVLKQLGRLVKDVWQTFTGLLDAAAKAGGNALGILGQLVHGMNEWVNSAKGQETLVAIFKALQDIGRALLPVITSLVGAISTIAPEAAKVATALGPVLAQAIEVLGRGIAALGPGLVRMVESFGRMVEAIGPLEPLGAAIGDIFAALGGAAALVVPPLVTIATAVAPALAAALNALGPALAQLGPGLVALAGYLAKAFADPALQAGLLALGKGISDLLVAAAPLLPVIAQVAGVLGQILAAALSNLGSALGPIIAALSSALEPALRAISDALAIMLPYMQPIYAAFGQIGAALITQLLPPLLNLVPVIINSLIPAFAQLARDIQPLIPLLADLAVKFINEVLPAILPMTPELTRLAIEIARMGVALSQLVADIKPYIDQIIAIFQFLYDTLVGHSIIPDLINGMTKWFRDGVQWIKDAVSWFGDLPGMIGRWMGDVLSQVQNRWNDIRSAISNKIDDIRGNISDVLGQIGQRWADGWSNVRNIASDAWNNIRNAVSNGANDVLNVVRGLPGQITGALGDLGGLLYNSGRSLMQGLINGVYSMWQTAYNSITDVLNHLRSLFPFSPAKAGPFSGRGWTLYSGRSMMTGLAEGISGQQAALTGTLDSVLAAGAATLDAGLQMPGVAAGPPDFAGSFGAPAAAGGGVAGRTVHVENLNVSLQGVLDPTNPVSYRRLVESLRQAIRDLEREEFAGV
ncbi:hypothetical protein MF672_038745 [Actinomadura sp. ATCC 31491]|uniref:Tape measure protein n=1 Tax=Actinomadura luzonensis TaxID=2805427 RepID=A0ABT0G5M9_9ACTN|nr:hypothetical protein [Actinomadura luzonensis]MCK2219693.1 hypothetical protein [Actinomadura luzonensis]